MTLPPIHPLCGDNVPPLRSRSSSSSHNRRRSCLSAAWADPPTFKERRRAICSWSVGYGTLNEEDSPRKLTDFGALLVEPRGGGRRPIVTTATTAATIATRNSSKESNNQTLPLPHAPTSQTQTTTTTKRNRARDLFAMPGLKTLVTRRRNSGAGLAETSVPLVGGNKRKSDQPSIRAATSLANLKRCETVVALTNALRSSSSSSSIERVLPVNRLRSSPTHSTCRLCSRCSSLLSLASSSRYSLNASTGGFVQIADRRSPLLCKLCLVEVPAKCASHLQQCNCSFCTQCMKAYVEFEIAEGAYDISCPDAQCPSQGVLQQEEIRRLVGAELLEKHNKYRLNREVEIDKNRMWCPRAGCETVCNLCPTKKCQPQSVHCPTCTVDFCSNCKLEWHLGLTCDEYNKQLAREGKAEDTGIPFDSDLIKCCPMCNVPIEKDEGCAQMMCKRCKHVFCWYCLASLDDDFLLRHYDRGPCKNKLGHSRASVIWHRTQVIGIFAGFGILLLVASPLLLLAAPCIICCKCRVCNAGTGKLDNEDDLPAETPSS